ncbi:MAG: PIG-L family deacetylase [Gemmatimonadaceae bacterium]
MSVRAFALLLLVLAPRLAPGQERGAPALDQLLRGLTVTSRVLMVGAHPDDEDTQLLAELVRGHQVHAAYLSLTRGDGGQNLIGNELGEALGAIRTEELLAARRVDGAHQFFTRAYDFGFSKSAEETFRHWDREQLTGDVVRVIRAFRPQVVVSVFSGTPADGHGHHQAAGIVARAGFEAAMDTVRFPVSTHGRPWGPSKFYRGAWSRNRPATLTMEVGTYDAVLGRSPAEIAGESRSQHRSQGFGVLQRRGAAQTRLTRELSLVNESTPATEERSLFDGIDTSFARLTTLTGGRAAMLAAVAPVVDSLRRTADLRRPSALVPGLARVVALTEEARAAVMRCELVPITTYQSINRPPPTCDAEEIALDAVVERLHGRARAALAQAAGVLIEAVAQQELVAFGDSLNVRVHIYNRGAHPVTLHELRLTGSPPREPAQPVIIPAGADTVLQAWVVGLVDLRPWWIGGRAGGGMFPDSRSPADAESRVSYGVSTELVPSVSLAEDARRVSTVRARIEVAGVAFVAEGGSVIRRFADPVLGEQNRPVGGVPQITIALDRGLEYVRAGQPLDRRLRVTLQSHTTQPRTLRFRLLLPAGVRATGVPDSLVLAAGAAREIYVSLAGQLGAGRHEFGIGAVSDGVTYVEGFTAIEYPHIRPLRLYRQSAMYLQAVPVTVPRALRVAYVTGVSDAMAAALRQLDIPVTLLSPEQVPLLDLSQYTTVVIGPRAYEASADLRAANPRLFEWVRSGGTLLVQYGQFEMAQPGMMPFPVGLRRPAARVTLEDAPVRVLDPQSRLLRWPNRIADDDWADWVQERALYMPGEIDGRYRTPLGMNDPDEPENRGAILEATLGQGRYVYTTLSLFRQLPAGVPGAARLVVNLLSAGLTPP